MLTLYRRHSDTCRKKLTLELKLPIHAHRQFRDCDCLIWMEGSTDNERYDRQSTKLRDWAAAEALVRSIQAEGQDVVLHGPTISQCITRYIDSRTDELGGRTQGQYTLTLTRLAEFAATRNVIYIRDLTTDLCKDFITYGLKMSKNSKSTYASKLKSFLAEAYDRKWIEQPIMLNKTPKATYEPADPFAEDEIVMILAAAEQLNGGVVAYAKHPHTFRLLLELMNETGMRCGDAIRYDPTLCVMSAKLWKYTYVPQKTRKDAARKTATVYLTDKLKNAIDQCKWMSSRRPFAYRQVSLTDSTKDDTTYMANEVYERMRSIGKRCVDKDGNPVVVDDCRPHRFRDSFAVRLLGKGMSLDAVSKLLNHGSVVVTEKHYAKWIESRLATLETQLSVILAG